MILFIQSTAVLHKYLNDELKILSLLQFFPEVAQFRENFLSFPCSEKSLSIPGLWPPCHYYMPRLTLTGRLQCTLRIVPAVY